MIEGYKVSGDGLVATAVVPEDLGDTVWIDLQSPTREEEQALEGALSVDLPTREDMEEIEQSSRLYAEGGAQFMTAIVPAQTAADTPIMAPVTFVLVGGRLITIRYHDPHAFTLFVSRAGKGGLACATGEQVMLSLLEVMVDRLADVLERVGRDIDAISRGIFARDVASARPRGGAGWRSTLEDIGRKGDLISNIRDSLGTLDRLAVFYAQRIRAESMETDAVERSKDLISDIRSLSDHSQFAAQKVTFLLDATLGLIGIEQNRIMQIFSVVSVVFLPPTLVASVYGMNFAVMPELTWPWGYPAALALIVMSAVGPYLVFRKKGWL